MVLFLDIHNFSNYDEISRNTSERAEKTDEI